MEDHIAVDGFIPKRRLRLRSFRVLTFFAVALTRILFWDVVLRRIGFRKISVRTAEDRHRQIARGFRHLAVSLGGIWIKIGQFLSARVDVLPEAITSELAGLQDEVPPEAFEDMEAVIKADFGDDWGSVFPWIQQTPLASASLGQVHRARLPENQAVVLKIQRPGIHRLVEVDLASLSRVIGWLKRYRPIARRVDLEALKDEFARTIWEELDYLAEAENAGTFAEMFAEDPEVRIPQVYPEQTTRCVLTLEDVYFIKITHYDEIEATGIDRSEVADRLFRVYLHQIFEQGFFHADPHPGNLFVEPGEEGTWRLVFVDFGMVGRVTEQVRQGLRDLVIAVGTRDVDRLILAYQELDVLLPGADLERIKQAERVVFDRFWGMSMDEFRRVHPEIMREFAREYRDLLYDLPFQVPKDMIYLGRCVAILSGMCSGLDPQFNLFEGIRPFAEKLLAEEGGTWVDILLDQLVEQGSALARLPKRLDQTMALLERGDLKVEARLTAGTDREVRRLARALDRLVWAMLFGVLFLTGAFLLTREIEAVAYLSLGVSVLFLLKLLLS